jgi:CRP-like cAMP-binding protein
MARLPGDAADARLSARLADVIDEVALGAGEPLYAPGDTSEHAFVVAEGRVVLETAKRRLAFGPGAPVGLLDAIRRRPRVGRARAEGDARVLRFRVDDWLELLEDNFTYARNTIITASRIVHELSLAAGAAGAAPPAPAPSGDVMAPPCPGAALDDVERALVLRAVPALSRASVQSLMALAGFASDLHAEPGARVFEAGRRRHLHFVASGLVRVRRLGERPVEADFGPGTLVGGLGALGGHDEQSEARAAEPSALIVVEREDYFDLMEDHFDMVRSVLTALIDERERLLSVEATSAL